MVKGFKRGSRSYLRNILCLIFAFAVSFVLIFSYVNRFTSSDYPAHIRQALRGEGYSLVSFMVRLLNKVDASNTLFIAFMALMTALTVMACAFYLSCVMKLLKQERSVSAYVPIALSALFLCKLCIPEWSPYFYVNAFVTQSWHNSTYTLMRLFAILTMAYYFIVEDVYREKIILKDLVLFTLALAFADLSKPNFVIVFAPVMLYRLVFDFLASKGKTFRNAFLFGVCVLIASAVLLFQFKTSFPEGGENGVAFSVANALAYVNRDKKLPLYFILNYAFPIYVTVLMIMNRKKAKGMNKRILAENWAMAILSILVYLFITETGPRAADGNFGWGMSFFAYALFMCAYAYLEAMYSKSVIDRDHYLAGKFLYFLHIFFGIFYFGLLLLGYLSWGF